MFTVSAVYLNVVFPKQIFRFLITGEDYHLTGFCRGTGNSNLEWRPGNSAPNVRFIVPIIDDDIPEPVEVLEIVVECEDNENCYLPRRTYTITIIDDQGTYSCRAYILGHVYV